MIQEKLRKAAFSFAQEVSRLKILYLVLFGSTAEGTDQKKSDLDFLVVFDSNKKNSPLEEKITRIAQNIQKQYQIEMDLIFCNRNFDNLDPYFLQKVFGNGIFLYAHSPKVVLNNIPMIPHSFLVFSLKELSQSDKMKVRNRLYGYHTIKKVSGKEYKSRYQGLLKEIKGKRLGQSAVVVPRKNVGIIKNFFEEFGVQYSEIDTWMI